MAKFCGNCGNEVDERAAVCIHCGSQLTNKVQNNQQNSCSKKALPGWAIVLIVIGSIILVGIIAFTLFVYLVFNVAKDHASENFNDLDYYFETGENETLRGTIGDTLKSNGYNITLKDASVYSEIEGAYYTDTPKSGKEFLVFSFEIENTSNESTYISNYDFDGCVDGYSITPTYISNNIDEIEELGTTLAPGKKTLGFVAFEVDTSWEEFEIHFEDDSNWEEEQNLIFRVVSKD